MQKYEIPIWEKVTMTVDEAAAYSNIGVNKIRKMAKDPRCTYAMYVGNRLLIKRKEFENYISNQTAI